MYPHHGNVVTFLEGLDSSAIVQYGLRGLVPNRRKTPGRNRRVCGTIEQTVAALEEFGGKPLLVSLDVDVFDPFVIDSVTSPCPNGLDAAMILLLLSTVARMGHKIQLFDLAEFAPTGENARIQALYLVDFLLRATDCILHPSAK